LRVGPLLALQAAGDALAHQRALLLFFRENLRQRFFNEFPRHAFAAQFLGDAGAPVAPGAGAVAGVAEGEAAVVKPATGCQSIEQGLDARRLERPAFQLLAKFGGGVGAAGQSAEGVLFEGVVAETGQGTASRARSP